MNRRNALISRFNSRRAILDVNDKAQTKRLLAAAGVPVPRTLALISSREMLQAFDFDGLPPSWALKPNRGRRGEGVLLALGRKDGGWIAPGDQLLDTREVVAHVSHVLDGELSLEGTHEDSALIEPLLRPHEAMARLIPFGLPDIRVICFKQTPLMAMTRLPTVQSGGRANLHQGAIGAAIDLESGRIFRAVQNREPIRRHPSTDALLIGHRIPFWQEIIEAASLCSEPLRLGYVGVDVVIDVDEGIKVLECNAYPGLEIQNVNAAGLHGPLKDALRRHCPGRASFWSRAA
jgi:alpha-L-glutamate ligase-like protein